MEINVKLNDIYQFMNQYLKNINYEYLDQNIKKEFMEKGIKKYLIDKIRSYNVNIIVNEYDEVHNLIEILSFIIGIDNQELNHLINYLIIQMSNEQKFAISWENTQDERYFYQPEIIIQNSVITSIKTNRFGNLTSIFNTLNHYYKNNFNQSKTR